MTDQTIPAEKVRALIEAYEDGETNYLLSDLRALLPASPQPTSGLLGRWAHDGFGQVLIISDGVLDDGTVPVLLGGSDWTDPEHVPFDSLAFPEQATKPEDVPAGEAWLVDVNAGELSLKSALAIKDSNDTWLTLEGATRVTLCSNGMITLRAPLTPEHPGKDDLQAKYDALKDKYAEAQEKIAELKEAITPRTATTKTEYAALPEGSVVAQPGELDVYIKNDFGVWDRLNTTASFPSLDLAGITRSVLRYGWGDAQPKPAWRIEHDHMNIRVGEYIIDKAGDGGTVTHESSVYRRPRTNGSALCLPLYAPWIVFPSKDAATPESILEAKRARDKEMDK